MSTSAPLPPLRTQQHPPLYRDVRVIRWVGQLAALILILAFGLWLASNVRTNLSSSGLPPIGVGLRVPWPLFEAGEPLNILFFSFEGFGFLQGRFGSAIPGLEGSAGLTVWQAFLAGYMNTVRVIVVGIPFCTLIGILIGIARLSSNAAVRAFGTAYVEIFRNIPALVWIFIAYYAISLSVLPQILDAPTPLDAFVVSNRGIGIPWINPAANRLAFVGAIGLALIGAALVVAWRGSVNARTGEPARGGLYGTATFLILLAIGNFAVGNALALDPATIQGRQVGGGMTITPAYFAVTVALTLYTASHVAEIVRGAILAIHKGQTEAANAIALTTFQRYRFIILPQAFRIMIPPLANQYLNITKNSSLAVAATYIEIAAIFTRIVNNAAPAVQGIIILMILYLTFSLSISLVANIINNRLSLETR